jgi:hypothetical protein
MNEVHIIKPEAVEYSCRIAEEGSFWAQREVARLFSCLKTLESKLARSVDFWNVGDSASGLLESHATLNDGTPVWRLCPTHYHCIALVAMHNGDLLVLEICSRAEIDSVERKLVKTDSVEKLINIDPVHP